jgi:hypothetical protein
MKKQIIEQNREGKMQRNYNKIADIIATSQAHITRTPPEKPPAESCGI